MLVRLRKHICPIGHCFILAKSEETLISRQHRQDTNYLRYNNINQLFRDLYSLYFLEISPSSTSRSIRTKDASSSSSAELTLYSSSLLTKQKTRSNVKSILGRIPMYNYFAIYFLCRLSTRHIILLRLQTKARR